MTPGIKKTNALKQQLDRLPNAYQKLIKNNREQTPRAMKKAIFKLIVCLTRSSDEYTHLSDLSEEISLLEFLYDFFDNIEYEDVL